SIHVDPPSVKIAGPDARFSLLISSNLADGRVVDLTRDAKLAPVDPRLLRVERNVIRPLADGKSSVRVESAGKSMIRPVEVTGSTTPRQFHCENDIVPLFARFGCNSSGCHGKAEGQNGFKLSVFGFDSAADYSALLKEARGRRVFPAAPERSLLL